MDPHSMVDVTEDEGVDVAFMYTVKWKATEIPFEKRMEKYSQSSSLPHHLEIHWFSIINSCVTVLFLTGFLPTILMRVLKNAFMSYDLLAHHSPYCHPIAHRFINPFFLVSSFYLLQFSPYMLKTRKLLMMKRRRDVSTFMVMFSGYLGTGPYSRLPLVLALSYTVCKNLLMGLIPFFLEALLLLQVTKLGTYNFLFVFSIPTTEELYLLHWWLCMLSHLALLPILVLPSIFNLKGLIGLETYC